MQFKRILVLACIAVPALAVAKGAMSNSVDTRVSLSADTMPDTTKPKSDTTKPDTTKPTTDTSKKVPSFNGL